MLQYGYDERTEILKKEVDPMTQTIQMKTPLVEMDGDEMTRILWKMIKDILILPYIDLKSEYYDLGMKRMTRSPLSRRLPQKNTESLSNAPPLRQMRPV